MRNTCQFAAQSGAERGLERARPQALVDLAHLIDRAAEDLAVRHVAPSLKENIGLAQSQLRSARTDRRRASPGARGVRIAHGE